MAIGWNGRAKGRGWSLTQLAKETTDVTRDMGHGTRQAKSYRDLYPSTSDMTWSSVTCFPNR